MGFRFSQRSLDRLSDVHPDLVKVAKRAIELSPYDFGITEGLRTLDRQKELLADGRSTTLNSRHLMQDDGNSHALDFAVYVNGDITWEVGYYRKVVQAFMTAAIEEQVQINSGALWRTFVDGPHIELNINYNRF
jgi:peptidoglycan L-alanyl-D-glutamate endopeptidase CwlK